eukprot:SAG22_NODE_56_length_23716_cov_11.146759_14_plen_115_part_00
MSAAASAATATACHCRCRYCLSLLPPLLPVTAAAAAAQGNRVKLTDWLPVPAKLDLAPFLAAPPGGGGGGGGPAVEGGKDGAATTYTLCGVLMHTGGGSGSPHCGGRSTHHTCC